MESSSCAQSSAKDDGGVTNLHEAMHGWVVDHFGHESEPERTISVLMQSYGIACFRAQVLESSVRLVLLAPLLKLEPRARDEAMHRGCNELEDLTLGQLIRRARANESLPPEVLSRLQHARDCRNLLIHHFLERLIVVGVVGGMQPLIDECRKTTELLYAIDKEVEPYWKLALVAVGISTDELGRLLASLEPSARRIDAPEAVG
jgi:hypothetical protein